MAFLHQNMTIKETFPHEIETLECVWIPLADGTRLAARIWRPVDATDNPVPALLEYLPYRRNDGTLWRDSIRHPYLAGHGYAAVRVDMRGNGDSDGLMLDEYTPQELSDALEVLAWLEAQPWCTGNVGIFGKSWGGFNALQIAALNPPQLKAIITIASTDNRFTDDVHYMGGAVLASEMLSWASHMLCYNASPPDPRYVGSQWREMWLHRLENTPPFVEEWLSHQTYDAFWKHGSVCETYDQIKCAVYAVGSWADGYTNAVPRLLEHLSCPKKGLLGPWAHNFPENSSPEPAIGFLQESLRWWDYWLKGEETDIMAEPMVRSWIQHSFVPDPNRSFSDGYWVVDPSWPSPHVGETAVPFPSTDSGKNSLKGSHFCGLESGRWLSFGEPGSFAPDQRGDNGRSLTYTTPPQEETVVLGFPKVDLTLKVDKPQAALAVRLCDVAPDGATTLVTTGLYNLSHRNGSERPEAMPVETAVSVTIPLNMIGHELKEGHRWQVAISPTYWPHLWPAPEDVTVTVEQCTLRLPVRTAHAGDGEIRPFAPPECAPPIVTTQLTEPITQHQLLVDTINQMATRSYWESSGEVAYEGGLTTSRRNEERYIIQEGAPHSANVICIHEQTFGLEGWYVHVKTHSEMTADAENFYLKNELTTFDGEEQFFHRVWVKTIPRHFQ